MISLSVRRIPLVGVLRVACLVLVMMAVSPSATAFASAAERPGLISVDDPAVTSGLAWHLDASGVRSAWRVGLGQGITVAVIDSGVDRTHPDLAGQVTASVSCLDTGGLASRCRGAAGDANGHGTHVAGLIAARGDDGIGVVGVAPRARLLAVRALRSTCGSACTPSGATTDLAAGVRWSVAHGADIINLSIAGNHRLGVDLDAAIDDAWKAGVITVLAAGQRGDGPLFFDARRAVVVTATDRDGRLAPYAPAVDTVPFGIAAPGGLTGDTPETCHVGGRPLGIVSTLARGIGDGSGYGCLAGTSMAAAQVSGALALVRSLGFTPDQAIERVLDSALPSPGLGAGSLDLSAAVNGPLPRGIGAHLPDFGTTRAASALGGITAGPFSDTTVVWVRRRPPAWIILVVGGLGAGVIADLWMRHDQRRRAARDAGIATGTTDSRRI